MERFLITVCCMGLLLGAILAFLRYRYVTETWPADLAWRRLQDLEEHEPHRLWTVYSIDRKAGKITLIGLRRED